MADSFITYTGDGSTTIFSIPFGYLTTDHLTATVDGVTTAVTYPTAGQFEFTTAPGNATAVTLTRNTPRTTREVVWQDAANLSAGDLNTSDLQLLYVTQEAFDASTNNITLASDDTWDALTKRIKNLATPTAATDAATKAYADANIVLTNADVISAEAAKDAAELAQTGAETAESGAQTVLAQMQILYDDWDDRYLGTKASDPTLDNDGDALIDGALYFNTTSNNLRVYDLGSTTWLVVDTVIPDNSVTNAKLSTVATQTIKGRNTAGTGDVEDLSVATLKTMLSLEVTNNHLTGLTLSNDADTAHDINVTAGQATDSTNASYLTLASEMTKQIDVAWAAGDDAGGLFSGTVAADTTYHVFLIEKDSDSSIDVGFDTSATAANIPAGYTKYRRIGSIITDSSSNILPFTQRGNHFELITPVLDLSTGLSGTSANTGTLASVPDGIEVEAKLNVATNSNGARMYVSALTSADLAPSQTLAPLSSSNNSSATTTPQPYPVSVWTNTSAQFRYRTSASVNVYVATIGWNDLRGQ